MIPRNWRHVFSPRRFLPALRCLVVVASIGSGMLCSGRLDASEGDVAGAFYRIFVRNFGRFDWTWNTARAYVRYEKESFEETIRRSWKHASGAARSSRHHAIRSVLLRGELRDSECLEGTGSFEILRGESAVPLEPLGFWLVDPQLSDGTKITLASNVTTSYLVFPSEPTASLPATETGAETKTETVDFQWSLRGRRDSQGKIVFDLSIPRALYSVMELTIPEQWTPNLPMGIVEEIPGAPHGQAEADHTVTNDLSRRAVRTWRIFPGTRDKNVLSLGSTDPVWEAKNRQPYRQQLTYDFRVEGLNVKSEFFFDRPSDTLRDVVLESDKRLQILSVQCGSRTLSWTSLSSEQGRERAAARMRHSAGENDPLGAEIEAGFETEIDTGKERRFLSIPEGESRLVVHACASIPWNRDHALPGIRLESPDHFWTETRADVFVTSPLLLCDIAFADACRISHQDQAERSPGWIGEGYSFLYFTPDANIDLEVTLHHPEFSWKSGTLVRWERERMTATFQIDLSSSGENAQLVELLVQPGWTIDTSSIETFPKSEFLVWEGEVFATQSRRGPEETERAVAEHENTGEKSLFLFLTKPTKLSMTGHFPSADAGSLNLRELLPARVRQSYHEGSSGIDGDADGDANVSLGEIGYGKHMIALTTDTSNQLKLSPSVGQLPQAISYEDRRIREHFFSELPPPGAGEIYFLDTNSRLVDVKLEPMKLRFESKIDSRITLHDGEFEQEYVFTIKPREHRLDHVYVHFSQESEIPWQWSFGGGEALPQPRALSEEERNRLRLSAPSGGTIWEIRFRSARSGADFQFTAVRRVRVAERIAVPLAMLPESLNHAIEIMIDAPYTSGIDVLNTRLKTIPVAGPPKDEYQTIRSAFRYDPDVDGDSSDRPALFLYPISGEQFQHSAWVWSLQLDSLFETEGIVQERATFFIENRGQKQATISFPRRISRENILAVGIDNQRAPRNLGKSEDGRTSTITVTLPQKKRFTTISVDYWYRERPLVSRKKLRPNYPSVDLPVMSGTWIAWTPGEFQSFLRGKPAGRVATLQRDPSEFQLLAEPGLELISDPVSRREFSFSFDPFSRDDWRYAFSFDQRKTRCTKIAAVLLKELGNERTLRSSRDRGTRDASEDGTPPSTSAFYAPLTFRDVWENETFLTGVFGDFSRHGSPTILIDWPALSRIGIFPSSPLQFSNGPEPRADDVSLVGYGVLERAGLSVLLFEERSVLITSALNAAKYQHELVSLNGERIKLVKEGPLFDLFRETKSGQPIPQWIPVSNWINRNTAQTNPWKDASPSSRIAATVSGWNAIELQRTESMSGIYVAHRPTFSALSGFTFLLVVMVTRWRPLSRLRFLFLLLIVFGVATKLLSPFYAIIPGGAFFGTLFAIGFSLIRKEPESRPGELPLIAGLELPASFPDESSDAAYEIKELRPFHNPAASQGRENFFDTLRRD